MRKIEIFGIRINPLSKDEFLSIIELNLINGFHMVQTGINAASVVECINNNELKVCINDSDLVNVDGISVVWALRFLGYKVPERVPCPDLAEDILNFADRNNYSVFLLGAQEAILLSSVKRLHERFPDLRIVGYRNGYFKPEDELSVVKMINIVNPDIILVGMPSPGKEFFLAKYKHSLNAKYSLGVGGFFDILSGFKKRAPLWMQKIGVEWLFRFMQEPSRMWRRYLIGNTRFIFLIIKEKYLRLRFN